MSTYRYKAFISYSHSDERWADWLQRRLEGYRPPKGLGPASALSPVFRDREDMASSADLSAAILDALESAENLIVICSPAAAASLWVRQEIQTFIDLGRRGRIHCLLVDGEPGDGDDSCLPLPLRRADGHEPLAADVRPGGDGRRLALLKLAAGILGLDLMQLRQRDLHRRNRRLLALAAGSVSATLVMTILAAFALMSRNDAIDARTETELRQQQAESLISFMLGDLRAKLESVGRLDVLSEVGVAASEYFSAVPAELLSDGELHQRAKSIRQLGVDRVDEGDLAAAMTMFRESLRMDTALAGRDSQKQDWQLALADDHYWIGVVHYNRDELEPALMAFLRQRDRVAQVAAGNLQDSEIRTNLAYVSNNVGLIQRQLGNLTAALDSLESARVTLIGLAEDDGDRYQLRDAVDVTVAVADLEWRIGDLSRAELLLQEALGLAQSLAADHANDVDPQEVLGLVHSYRARVFAAQGNPLAFDEAEAELSSAERRILITAGVPDARRAKARAQLRLAELQKDDGALVLADTAHAVLIELAGLDPTDMRRLRDLVEADFVLARLQQSRGADAEALLLLRDGLARMTDMDGGEMLGHEANSLRIEGSALLGALLNEQGNVLEAEQLWRRTSQALNALGDLSDGRMLLSGIMLQQGLGIPADTLLAELLSRGWSREYVQDMTSLR